MSVLVYIESPKGHIKKTGYEVASYAVQVAKTLGTDAIALFIGAANDAGSAGRRRAPHRGTQAPLSPTARPSPEDSLSKWRQEVCQAPTLFLM